MNWVVINWVDWAIIAIVGCSALLSLWRGFVREALSLLGWIAAFLVSYLLGGRLALQLSGVIDNEAARFLAAYAILFIGVLLLANLLAVLMSHLVRLTGLGVLDRILGTIFGFTRGVIIILVLVFVAGELLPYQEQQALRLSQLMPHLEMLMHWVQTVFAPLRELQIPTISI